MISFFFFLTIDSLYGCKYKLVSERSVNHLVFFLLKKGSFLVEKTLRVVFYFGKRLE